MGGACSLSTLTNIYCLVMRDSLLDLDWTSTRYAGRCVQPQHATNIYCLVMRDSPFDLIDQRDTPLWHRPPAASAPSVAVLVDAASFAFTNRNNMQTAAVAYMKISNPIRNHPNTRLSCSETEPWIPRYVVVTNLIIVRR